MICRFCGLETGSGVGHQSQSECIKALTDAIARAKQLIDRARDDRARSALAETAPRVVSRDGNQSGSGFA